MSTNWALASNGGVASGTNGYSGGAGGAYDLYWANNGGSPLYDGTASHAYGADDTDNLVITFSSAKDIVNVVVWFGNFDTRSTDPSDSDTGANVGIDFTVDTWNGSSWVTQATITSNDKLKRSLSFASVSTSKIRLTVTSSGLGQWLLQELQAFDADVANVGAASGSSSVNGVGNSQSTEGAMAAAGTSTAAGVSSMIVGTAVGAASATSVGQQARTGATSSVGSSRAYAHPPVRLNYGLGWIATTAQWTGPSGETSASGQLNNDVRFGAQQVIGVEQTGAVFRFASAHWLLGARIYSGCSADTAEPGPGDTFVSGGIATEWTLRTGSRTGPIVSTYTGAHDLKKQELLIIGEWLHVDEIYLSDLGNSVRDVEEIQVIGIGQIYSMELEDGAVAADSIVAVHTLEFESTGDASDTLIGNRIGKEVSSGDASSTVELGWTEKAVGAASGGSTVQGRALLDVTIEETASAEATVAFVRALKLQSTGAVSASVNAKQTTSLLASGEANAELEGENSITQTEESTGEATDTVIGIRRVTVIEESGGVGTNTPAPKKVAELELATVGVAGALAVLGSHQIAELESAAHVEDFLPAPFTGTYPVFWSNSQLAAGATWEGLPFNSFIEAGGVVYAAGPTGLFELGDADVASEIQWDLSDFGSPQLKRARSLYIHAKTRAPFTVRVANEQGVYDYPTETADSEDLTNHRAPIGRGLSSRHTRISILSSVSFVAENAGLGALPSQRRI